MLYALIGGFVLAFPGPWQHMLWFVPAGMAITLGLNVLRVAALALNHHYAFTFVVYACIFGLWMLWARRLAVRAR